MKKMLKTACVLLFWAGVWYAVALIANRSLIIDIPTPHSTVAALFRLAGTPGSAVSVLMSVLRIAAGYAAAVVIGVLFGCIAYRFRFFSELTAPVLYIIRAMPVAALIIVIFLWMSKDAIPMFVAFLLVMPMVWSSTEAGLRSVDGKLLELASVMDMPAGKKMRYIVMPAVMVPLRASLVTGFGFAWKSGVAAEVICRTASSIGNMLWVSKNAVDYDEVFAIALTIVLLSVITEKTFKLLVRGGEKNDKD